MRLALFQPDIPQNTGTLLRLGACLDVPLDIIEPCGFIFNEKAMRRAGMDYLEMVPIVEIANRVGFSSSSYFAKCFKEMFGVLPKQYAEDYGKKD